MTTDAPDDIDRLIQDVLSQLGYQADAAAVARRVRRLNLGLPAEDEFSVICAWLKKCALVHKLDQAQAPLSSRDAFQVPDLLAVFERSGPVLVEVKSSKSQTLSFKPDYLARLRAYADLIGHPLLIAWKFHRLWTLFDVRCLQLARTNFNISHETAMKENLMGVLAGDVAYTLQSGAGVHFDCAKETLEDVEDHGDTRTETWKMRVSDVFFTGGGGVRRDDLHGETKQLLTTWDLESKEAHAPDKVRMSFVVGDGGLEFAHTGLVHLLSREGGKAGRPLWRQLLQAPQITRTVDNFSRALDRGLKEGVVQLVLQQQPTTMPDFIKPTAKDSPAGGIRVPAAIESGRA